MSSTTSNSMQTDERNSRCANTSQTALTAVAAVTALTASTASSARACALAACFVGLSASCGSTPSPMGPLGTTGSSAAQSTPAHLIPRATMAATLQHVVLVDLADDADIPAMRAASDAALPGMPMVKGYVCGAPVDIGRANVSQDYDLGIIVQFDSVDDYKAYLEHPVHQELVRTWRPKWRKSYIVDFAP